MPKGYWIAHGDVSDPAAYESYKAANAAPLAEFGGQFVVRGAACGGGNSLVIESSQQVNRRFELAHPRL